MSKQSNKIYASRTLIRSTCTHRPKYTMEWLCVWHFLYYICTTLGSNGHKVLAKWVGWCWQCVGHCTKIVVCHNSINKVAPPCIKTFPKKSNIFGNIIWCEQEVNTLNIKVCMKYVCTSHGPLTRIDRSISLVWLRRTWTISLKIQINE